MIALIEALSNWRTAQRKALPGEPAIMIPTDKIGIVTYEDGSTKAVLRADDLIEILVVNQHK